MGKINISESELKSLIKKVIVRELKESIDTDRYEDVVFLQGDEADEALEILNNQGEDAAMDYLIQWHDPGHHMGSSELNHGSSDNTYERDGYIMSYNIPLNYIGLQYEFSGMNESKHQDNKKRNKQKKFNKVMGEFGDGTLKTPSGDVVTDRKQALAIAYSESGLNESVLKEDSYNKYEHIIIPNGQYVLLRLNRFINGEKKEFTSIGQIKDKETKIKDGKYDNSYKVAIEPDGELWKVDKTHILKDSDDRRDLIGGLNEANDFYDIQSQVSYPKGGNIGGPHKQPIKDKDFDGTGTLNKGEYSRGYNTNIEWLDKQVDRLFGLDGYDRWMPRYGELNIFELTLKRLFEYIMWGRTNEKDLNTFTKTIKSFLHELPKEFSTHFGIDRDSDKSVLSFTKNGLDSFIGNYKEFEKLKNKGRPEGALTHESKQKLYNIVEGVVRKVMLEKQDNFKILLGVITSQKGNEWRVKGDSNESFYVIRVKDGLLLQMPPEINQIGANPYGYGQVKNEIEKLINQKESGLIEATDLKHYTLTVKHDNGKVNLKTTASSEKEAKEKIMKTEGCPESAILSCKEVGNVIKEGVAINNPKIEKYVNQINELISQSFDSEGDPIGVVDPTSTWEEPYVYEPIIYKNGALKIVSYSNYKPNDKNIDIIRSRDMEFDGIPTLRLISRMYKKALRNKDKEPINTDI